MMRASLVGDPHPRALSFGSRATLGDNQFVT